jgi:hypothetical protein
MRKKNKIRALIAESIFSKPRKGTSHDVLAAHMMQSKFIWAFKK